MEISKTDWRLFREKLSEWQENYMDRLIKEYISLLNKEKASSEKFWELEKRINRDKRSPGVGVQFRKSDMLSILLRLISDDVICYDDLNEFSDDLRDTVKTILNRNLY